MQHLTRRNLNTALIAASLLGASTLLAPFVAQAET